MEPSEFLKAHSLEIAVFEGELEQVRGILKELNRDYVLSHTEEKDTYEDSKFGVRHIFRVHCPTTNFAMAFFWMGTKMNVIYRQRGEGSKNTRTGKTWTCPHCNELINAQGKGGHLFARHGIKNQN